jgi:Ca2+-binding RTX toxin-like protein
MQSQRCFQRVALLVSLAGMCCSPGLAHGATVSLTGGEARYVGGGGSDQVRVVQAGNELRLTQEKGGIQPGPGCAAQAPRTVSCSVVGLSALRADLRGGNDTLILSGSLPAYVGGGTGRDTIGGGNASNRIIGGPGNDLLGGDGAADSIVGGAGNDFLRGAGGTDHLLGGPGNDVLAGGRDLDTLAGAGGRDQLLPGRDRVGDLADCGTGLDFAAVYEFDRVRGCEFLKRR